VNVEGVSSARRSPANRGTKEAVPRPPLSYKEALAWLYSLQRFGIKLGLENIRRLIDELTRKGDFPVAHGGWEATAPWKVIHVAGTNGKGSVCAMIDSICRAANYRTGLFTSPHLVTFRERIRVNGEMISEAAVASGLTNIRNLVADWQPHPTFFEVATALALKYFSEAEIDIVILETGLGGRLDATNAVQSTVAVFTPIDLDHQKWLGNSLERIASEKAGIIKSGVPIISAPQKEEVETVLRKRADECGSSIEFLTAPHKQYSTNLLGDHQKLNAALGITALRAAKSASRTDSSRGKIEIDDSAIARGLATVDWPARFQRWDERTIIDGAHNPAAACVLVETWREIFGEQRATLILAILSDKDLRGICQELVPIADSVLLPKIRSERAADPKQLAQILSIIALSLPCSITPSIGEALELTRTKPNPILITGSLHFAGEALAYLRGEPAAFEECMQ
jgi:dihydrofolate synthase/folylpolyglutamate synthase